MLAEDGLWYSKDVGIYIGPPDGAASCNLDFVFRNIRIVSANSQFVAVNTATFTGSIRLENCYLGNNRVTSANCYPVGGIPNLTIVSV